MSYRLRDRRIESTVKHTQAPHRMLSKKQEPLFFCNAFSLIITWHIARTGKKENLSRISQASNRVHFFVTSFIFKISAFTDSNDTSNEASDPSQVGVTSPIIIFVGPHDIRYYTTDGTSLYEIVKNNVQFIDFMKFETARKSTFASGDAEAYVWVNSVYSRQMKCRIDSWYIRQSTLSFNASIKSTSSRTEPAMFWASV